MYKRQVSDIIYYGTSLGSGVATQLALQHKPKLLILDAPFNSMTDMAQFRMPILPAKLLLKDKWASDKALRTLDVPLIWIHGGRDRVIPISQGQKLYDGYDGAKTALVIPESDHFLNWQSGGKDIVMRAIEKI